MRDLGVGATSTPDPASCMCESSPFVSHRTLPSTLSVVSAQVSLVSMKNCPAISRKELGRLAALPFLEQETRSPLASSGVLCFESLVLKP